MSELTCEIDGKIFEGIPCNEDADTLCKGCAGHGNPYVCVQLDDCYVNKHNIIWIAAA